MLRLLVFLLEGYAKEVLNLSSVFQIKTTLIIQSEINLG